MWKALIKKLLATGLTQAQIGARVGLSQPAISNIAAGRYKHGPRGDCAMKLIRLAAKPPKRKKS